MFAEGVSRYLLGDVIIEWKVDDEVRAGGECVGVGGKLSWGAEGAADFSHV